MASSPLVTARTQTSFTGQPLPTGLMRLYPKLSQKNVSKPLCKFGERIAGKWIISGLIGKGGYGQIYFAYDATSPKTIGVAIKTEPKERRGKTSKRMILEQKILLRLQGRSHAPLMWGSGCTAQLNYIIMQLLSINLNDIRKQSPFRRFSRPTMGRIVIQAIAGLRDIHQLGYIHRDIKPQNMCFGLSEASKHRLIIVDYGLARRFRHSNGRLRPLREQCGFRGTTIYASLRSHEGKDLGPSDDLISLFYSAIEMVRGELPWKDLQRADDVKYCKLAMQCEDFHGVSKKVGEGFRELGRAVTSMDADDEPNYSALQDIMMRKQGWKIARGNSELKLHLSHIAQGSVQMEIRSACASRSDPPLTRLIPSDIISHYNHHKVLIAIIQDLTDRRKLSDPYDWDNNFQEVYRESDLNRALQLRSSTEN